MGCPNCLENPTTRVVSTHSTPKYSMQYTFRRNSEAGRGILCTNFHRPVLPPVDRLPPSCAPNQRAIEANKFCRPVSMVHERVEGGGEGERGFPRVQWEDVDRREMRNSRQPWGGRRGKLEEQNRQLNHPTNGGFSPFSREIRRRKNNQEFPRTGNPFRRRTKEANSLARSRAPIQNASTVLGTLNRVVRSTRD